MTPRPIGALVFPGHDHVARRGRGVGRRGPCASTGYRVRWDARGTSLP